MKKMNAHAIRDINPNEAITRSFFPNLDEVYEERSKELAVYGIPCICPKCAQPDLKAEGVELEILRPACTKGEENREKIAALKKLIWDEKMMKRPGLAMTMISIYEEPVEEEGLTHVLTLLP